MMHARGLLISCAAVATMTACAPATSPVEEPSEPTSQAVAEPDESHGTATKIDEPPPAAKPSRPSEPVPTCVLPSRPYRIEVVSAHIGPGTADGYQWESWEKVPPDLWQGLQDILASPVGDYGAKLAAFARKVVQVATQAPDPTGHAWIDRGDGNGWDEERDLVTDYNDTFTPRWNIAATWSGVLVNERTLIGVRLEDQDVASHDPIKPANITACDIAEAIAKNGKVHDVPVADQTHGELLYVGISAIAER